jgi:hypothetical protein
LAFVQGDGRAAISSGDKKVPVRTITEMAERKFPWLGIANGDESFIKGSRHGNVARIKKSNFGLSMSSPYLQKFDTYM